MTRTSRPLAAAVLLLFAGVASAQRPKSTLDGVYSLTQARAGERLYAVSCAGCHQPDLSGGPEGPALAGFQFNSTWTGSLLHELIEKVVRQMPPSAPGSLTRQEYTEIVAFILRRNSFPAGEKDLPTRASAVPIIRYEAEQP